MARFLTLLVLAGFVVTTLAGCSTPSADEGTETEPTSSEPPRRTGRKAADSTVDDHDHLPRQNVYAFAGTITGTSQPHPTDYGPLVPGTPPAKQDTFEAPNGTVVLEVYADTWSGIGTSRMEIYHPDGTLAYDSGIAYSQGPAGSGCILCSYYVADTAMPGTYRIDYYVSGSFDMRVNVDAVLANGTAP